MALKTEFKKWVASLKIEIKSHKVIYFVLAFLLLSIFFTRVYRVGDLMGFYYDQGRDALVIWDLWHNGKLFLIGPVTGLAGIFLGPFFYYLIAPFYLIGGGNPAYPAAFLAFLFTVALLITYILGSKMHSRTAGLLAVIVAGFSFHIFTLSRWLSNPNPMFLSSMVLLWGMWEVASRNEIRNTKHQRPNLWWIVIALALGVSFHFESASAIFYLPVVFVFILWQRRNLPKKSYILAAGGVLFLTFLPQIIFNFRHDNLLLNSFRKLLFEEKAFRGLTEFVVREKSKFVWTFFANKLFTGRPDYSLLFVTVSMSAFFYSFHKFKNKVLPLFLIFILIPIPFYFLFQGNFGNMYDYYLIGYALPFVLAFSIGLAELSQKKFGIIIVIFFFYLFFKDNAVVIRNYLVATPMTRPIALEDETQAVDWILKDGQSVGEFNVDVYVPPVIPHSYNYLLLWRGNALCGDNLCGKVEESRPIVYVLSEPETTHYERWNAWIDRYEENTDLVDEKSFGQVKVQKRMRK